MSAQSKPQPYATPSLSGAPTNHRNGNEPEKSGARNVSADQCIEYIFKNPVISQENRFGYQTLKEIIYKSNAVEAQEILNKLIEQTEQIGESGYTPFMHMARYFIANASYGENAFNTTPLELLLAIAIATQTPLQFAILHRNLNGEPEYHHAKEAMKHLDSAKLVAVDFLFMQLIQEREPDALVITRILEALVVLHAGEDFNQRLDSIRYGPSRLESSYAWVEEEGRLRAGLIKKLQFDKNAQRFLPTNEMLDSVNKILSKAREEAMQTGFLPGRTDFGNSATLRMIASYSKFVPKYRIPLTERA
jgi:hypothetical protein